MSQLVEVTDASVTDGRAGHLAGQLCISSSL